MAAPATTLDVFETCNYVCSLAQHVTISDEGTGPGGQASGGSPHRLHRPHAFRASPQGWPRRQSSSPQSCTRWDPLTASTRVRSLALHCKGPACRLPTHAPATAVSELHYVDGTPLTVQYLLVVDALNFCFWPGDACGLCAAMMQQPRQELHALPT